MYCVQKELITSSSTYHMHDDLSPCPEIYGFLKRFLSVLYCLQPKGKEREGKEREKKSNTSQRRPFLWVASVRTVHLSAAVFFLFFCCIAKLGKSFSSFPLVACSLMVPVKLAFLCRPTLVSIMSHLHCNVRRAAGLALLLTWFKTAMTGKSLLLDSIPFFALHSCCSKVLGGHVLCSKHMFHREV